MPNHLRQQIRERIGTTLTGLTTTGSNVYQSRIYPQEQTKLPCLLIYTLKETSELSSFGSARKIDRELNLVIEGIAQQVSNLDDKLDTIAKEIEVALSADLTVNALAKDIYLVSTDIEYERESKQPIGRVKLEYRVEYRNTETDPTTAA